MKAISTRSIVKFVPECDSKLPVEEQSKITIRPLTVEEEIILDDAIYRIVGDKRIISSANKRVMAIHLALVAIENTDIVIEWETVKDDEGVFRLTEKCFQSIPKAVRDEISNKVIEMQNPSEEERKN